MDLSSRELSSNTHFQVDGKATFVYTFSPIFWYSLNVRLQQKTKSLLFLEECPWCLQIKIIINAIKVKGQQMGFPLKCSWFPLPSFCQNLNSASNSRLIRWMKAASILWLKCKKNLQKFEIWSKKWEVLDIQAAFVEKETGLIFQSNGSVSFLLL